MSALTMARMAGVRRDARVMSNSSWFAKVSNPTLENMQGKCGQFWCEATPASALAVR